MPLVIQMSMDITGVQSAMAAKNEVRQKMHPVLLSMESNKDGMHSCLRLLLELAADMAPSGQIRCHKLQCLFDRLQVRYTFSRMHQSAKLSEMPNHTDLLHFL